MKKAEKPREAQAVNDADRTASAPEERDARGRFTAGNAGGPGNPFARRVAALRTILMECVSDDEMRHIAGQLAVMAKAGDLAAIKLLFQYVLGKPAATVDPDTLDQQEVDWFCREPPGRLMKELAGTRMPSEMMARFCRQAMPLAGQVQVQMFREEMLQPEEDLLKEDEEDDFDDDEEEIEEASAARVCSMPAPSPNGEKAADPRPRATRPSQNGGAGAAHAGRNGQPTGRPGCGTFIDPRQRE